MKATDLSVGDIGKKFRSVYYRDKNKTSLPVGQYRHRYERYVMGTPQPLNWTLNTLYAHENGNILINNGIYLRVDTEIERVEDND